MVFINIERYQKINIYAQSLEQVYPDAKSMLIANNMNFFNQCLKRFPSVSFSLKQGAEAYLVVRQKTYTVTQPKLFKLQCQQPELNTLFEQVLRSRMNR